MASYKVALKESVAQDLKALPNGDVAKVMDYIRDLATDPRPDGCERLSEKERYRIRISAYRVVYEVAGAEQVTVVRVNGGPEIH